ncbi:uncharacterized protein LOC127700266 [Mytilus californianus]|uniref:uncharacterized protein LOC127700266 n=1 Tax=Mytilus californianus TaxID=6549 RepID=UPI00224654E6|nr:uncharacterized protein LOC127700266 [Mytilus californianus]
MVGLSKSGYLEVKQPSNIKGRKLKTWKKKFVVVHKMTDLAAGTFAAKFLLYNDEDDSKLTTSDKQAYIFDHVTSVETAKSKTRPLAFKIVQEAPALMLSAMSEQETNDWMTSLKELFWPDENKPPGDTFHVTAEQNDDAKTWSLSGYYWLTVTPEIITIKSIEDNSIHEWNLNFIKRFFMDKIDVNILIIETGSISEFGEAHFRFRSTCVPDILAVIKQNIQKAIKLKTQRKRNTNSDSCAIVQGNSSTSSKDKSFQSLLIRSSDTQNSSTTSVSTVDTITTRSRSSSENSSTSADEYNSLNISSSRENETKIVSTLTVRNDNGRNIEVKIDQLGYSHVETVQNESEQTNIDVKARSASGCLENGDDFHRSTSVCSCDSGFAQSVTDSTCIDDTKRRTHISNNSFDSGISTSFMKPEISASIGGIFVVTENNSQASKDTFMPYSKVIEEASVKNDTNPITRKISNNSNYASIYWDAEVDTINVPSEPDKKENLYEDLDKYRKNLSKHLGFDPKINPSEVPPSLPDRPSTLPVRRKVRSKSTKTKDKKTTAIQEMFRTVTRGRTSSISSTSSNTSEGDEDKLNTTSISNRPKWPLPSTAVSGNNELYTSVPDEGVFSSVRPRARSYEDRPTKKPELFNDSIVSVKNWPMAAASNTGLNSVYDPIYSQVNKSESETDTTEISKCRSFRRSNSSIDLMVQDRRRLSQRAVDLLTGDLNDELIPRHSEILTPVLISQPEEPDFIDFATEISVPEGHENMNATESGDVWNPFPKIADFTNVIQPEDENSETLIPELNASDPFDMFHIGVISSSFGLSTENSFIHSDFVTEPSDLDKTIYNPNEEIYMDMGNQTLRQEQTVEYVLPTEVSRTYTS